MTKTKSALPLAEAIAARSLIAEILSRDLAISVAEIGAGWETILEASRDPRAIMRELGKSERNENLLTITTSSGEAAGWFYLVYGNEPCELVHDHSGRVACHEIWEAWDRTIPK